MRTVENVGLAFQITDDLLDVAGNQAAVGKRLAKDADRRKTDFSAVDGRRSESRAAEKLVDEACAMIEVFGAKAGPLKALADLCVSGRIETP